MNLDGFHAAVAAALEGLDPEWVVHPDPVDNLQPPCFLVQAAFDWFNEQTPCTDMAEVEVIVVGGRLTPEGGYPLIRAMTDTARNALAAAGLRPYRGTRPEAFPIAQVTYLAAHLFIRRPVELTVGGL